MRLLIDQNIPPQVADELTARSHPSEHVGRLGLAQASNGEIIRYALAHRLTLVTQDLGIASQLPPQHFGLITLRRVPISQMAQAIADTLQDLTARGISLENALVTIEPGRYRVHVRMP